MRSCCFCSLALTFLLIWPFVPIGATAQIVSLLVDADEEKDSMLMEIAMKNQLKKEGYEVKRITFGEGFFLYVQFRPIATAQEQIILG